MPLTSHSFKTRVDSWSGMSRSYIQYMQMNDNICLGGYFEINWDVERKLTYSTLPTQTFWSKTEIVICGVNQPHCWLYFKSQCNLHQSCTGNLPKIFKMCFYIGNLPPTWTFLNLVSFELGTISVMNEVIVPGSIISVIVVQGGFVIFVATRLVIHKHVKISESK